MKNTSKTYPQAQDYRMPAEWDLHEATWLTWPQNAKTWPDQLKQVEQTYARLINILSRNERVDVLVNDEATGERAARLISGSEGQASNVVFHEIQTDDAWLRDNGPTFVVRDRPGQESLALVNWEFNSWGKKYPPWDRDNAVPTQMAKKLNLPIFDVGRVLEGGSIEVNGLGTCLTTESCLLKPARNADLQKKDIEKLLLCYIGASHIIWLGRGITGDDTDGHVDTITRFVGPTRIVTALEEDSGSPNFAPLRENFNKLRSAADQDGKTFDVIALPMPPKIEQNNRPLPATYANFYIANGSVIVPTFNHRHDRRALRILQEQFPSREVIGIDARDLTVGLGAFHCITQQQPATDS